MNTKNNKSTQLTKEQLETLLASQENLQSFIDLATKMRTNNVAKDMDFFKQFFMKVDKFV